jgi:glucuronate isomerase
VVISEKYGAMSSQRRDPRRLFPSDPRTGAIAAELYAQVASAPIISPHGHVPVAWLNDDLPFADPADLLISHDHYVTRLLHSAGADLETLGVGTTTADPRKIWRTFVQGWELFAGTASGYWLEEELALLLGGDVDVQPDAADALYDSIAAVLGRAEFRPRALFDRFRIEVLATTDDPLDTLADHAALRGSGLNGRVLPTFRPDKYVDPDAAGFAENVEQLLSVTDEQATFPGYLRALESRRAHFIEHGAVSADHGVEDPYTIDMDPADADRLFQQVLVGSADPAARREFRGHMLLQMARMSVDDGLVMTVHAGILRNHNTATFRRFGPDSGHDIPVRTDFVRGLRPLLERYGLKRDFHLVLFAVDESTYSREIAPLAGFYPSVYIGAPWWFLDAPDAMHRFRSATVETAGFSRGSGFVDDTRAFLSIPARHDTARRVDAAFLARMVAEGRIKQPRAAQILTDIVGAQPKRVFKL